MAEPGKRDGLDALQESVATGDMDAVRERLLALDDEERAVLEARLGAATMRRVYQRVRRARRGPMRGRVVVLHGVMGSALDAVGADGDVDRIWLNYFRILAGRIAELRLGPGGEPASPRYRIRLGGLLPEYLPLLTELAERWEVLPVAYDWRHDVDRSADLLRDAIEPWAAGRPVHVVAHSMGGLVARRFVQRHPALWRSMADPDGLARGGRLVMLGTPNRGSLAVPLVLSGREKTVRMLEMLDLRHDMGELLRVVGTFAGVYQMLPSPEMAVGDDRAALFEPATWGDLPVHAPLLERARDVQRALEVVVDAERMLYVAGYDQRTPHRVRVDGPGRFSYQQTLDGDGRVPHELGLLDGVRTFWVRESHGDLARSRRVLDGIHDLLERGATTALESRRPVQRGVDEALARWQTGDDIEPIPAEVASAALRPIDRGVTGDGRADGRADARADARAGERADERFTGDARATEVARAHAARVEGWMLRDWLGTPGAPEPVLEVAERAARDGVGRAARKATSLPRLRVEVWWGDITRVPGDAHVVGHYENVLPQFAELALDRMVSG
ncbi:MAG TPA: hypothetical protein VFX39_02690, partial [Gemmatimonadaceae bacterium]|nr:hypothetical protein [Gemmatimonadaceae bacterium]